MPNFTDLPPELRISVYDFYFHDAVEHLSVRARRYPTILCISRQIASEAVQVCGISNVLTIETDRWLR